MVEVCPDCDIAGCKHIRERTGAFAPPRQSEQLLPCPFCGGEAEFIPNMGNSFIECESCGIDFNAGLEQSTGYEYREKMIAAWNTRTPQQASREVVERVAEALKNRCDVWAVEGDFLPYTELAKTAIAAMPTQQPSERGAENASDAQEIEHIAHIMHENATFLSCDPMPFENLGELSKNVWRKMAAVVIKKIRECDATPSDTIYTSHEIAVAEHTFSASAELSESTLVVGESPSERERKLVEALQFYANAKHIDGSTTDENELPGSEWVRIPREDASIIFIESGQYAAEALSSTHVPVQLSEEEAVEIMMRATWERSFGKDNDEAFAHWKLLNEDGFLESYRAIQAAMQKRGM